MYNNSVMIITRSGHSGFERAVSVEQGINRWLIDPHLEVALATNDVLALSRDGCILSFMEGLVAAGHMVILQERRKNKHWSDYHFTKASWISYEYFLFGLAWGKAQWWQLRTQLERTIVPTQRLAVLTATGQYYFTHRWENSIALRVPIS